MEPELMIAELPAVAPLPFVEAGPAPFVEAHHPATPRTTGGEPAEGLSLESVVTSLQVMLAVRRAARNADHAARST
jgi:hypothetical protein